MAVRNRYMPLTRHLPVSSSSSRKAIKKSPTRFVPPLEFEILSYKHNCFSTPIESDQSRKTSSEIPKENVMNGQEQLQVVPERVDATKPTEPPNQQHIEHPDNAIISSQALQTPMDEEHRKIAEESMHQDSFAQTPTSQKEEVKEKQTRNDRQEAAQTANHEATRAAKTPPTRSTNNAANPEATLMEQPAHLAEEPTNPPHQRGDELGRPIFASPALRQERVQPRYREADGGGHSIQKRRTETTSESTQQHSPPQTHGAFGAAICDDSQSTVSYSSRSHSHSHSHGREVDVCMRYDGAAAGLARWKRLREGEPCGGVAWQQRQQQRQREQSKNKEEEEEEEEEEVSLVLRLRLCGRALYF